ncbi:hypothetical protein [Natronobacterium gregoryi]|uniref:Uncharacterized protein n=2 Tax=Natronobacterium gregoryi TaxID=44930 RepID=L0AIP2_NATGS|nr:hypothetical protein [Natronobacterium gregoryi]AFZ73314.1 hypothetical protein Natgr_2133 [Natronobacterium gregoryi SP2]ELY73877.1 hypothetical protein C490_00915 [Natronobacterium gregoryi SP2]PLK19894.1 hypothetical protein CYV19_12340 [Natronobacterium gregoryi SP2]SFJ37581.1 hypothetical protein SAMN05443661_12520 [Natronobacterium gregoryi]
MACDRRHLLALVGTSGALAGCLEGFDHEPSPGGGGEGTAPVSSGGEDLPNCPGYGDRVDRVVCYDDVDDDRVFLEPSSRTATIGKDSVEFTLRNESDQRLATNVYNWRVDKRVDGEWYRVAPLGYNQPLMYVDPGGSHTWTFTPTDEEIDGEDGRPRGSGGTEDLTVPALGPGDYAFRARGWFEDERDEEILAFAVPVELEGDPFELTPSETIEEVDEKGGTLVARSSRGDPNGEHHRLGAYELTVLESAPGDLEDEPQPTITEQLLRRPRLRDAIALADDHDVSTVHLEEYDAVYPIFGSRSDGVYEYQDTYYRVQTRELEDED